MTEQIITIIGEILGVALVVAVYKVMPKITAWLESKIGAENMTKVESLVSTLVKSAEQQFKADDPDGVMRNAYVKEELIKLGYEITAEINAVIEAKVYELPKTNKEG